MAIENGFLEHALETAAIRPYFEQGGSDPRLEPAWKRALEWGDAHPDYMAVRSEDKPVRKHHVR